MARVSRDGSRTPELARKETSAMLPPLPVRQETKIPFGMTGAVGQGSMLAIKQQCIQLTGLRGENLDDWSR